MSRWSCRLMPSMTYMREPSPVGHHQQARTEEQEKSDDDYHDDPEQNAQDRPPGRFARRRRAIVQRTPALVRIVWIGRRVLWGLAGHEMPLVAWASRPCAGRFKRQTVQSWRAGETPTPPFASQ